MTQCSGCQQRLWRAGQFGTRLQGGKDASSPRYIFTRLATLTRHLFNETDDPLLHYLNEEGQDIEPHWCAAQLATGTCSYGSYESVAPHLSCAT